MTELEEGTPPPKRKKKWLVILIVLLLLGGSATAVWFFVLDQKLPFGLSSTAQPSSPEASSTAATAQNPMPQVALPDTIAALPSLIVNLSDPQGKKLIKISMTVELASPSVADELALQQPRIRDSLIMLLTSKSYADLATSESKVRLKNEVTDRINQTLGGPKIVQTFITDMIIQ